MYQKFIMWNILRAATSVAIVLIALTISACMFKPLHQALPIYSFDELITHLQKGEVSKGVHVLDPRIPKHFSDVWRQDQHGEHFGVLTYSDEYKVLLLYWHEHKIYGACLIEGVNRYRETWYFCDTDLLTRHVALAMAESTEPLATIKMLPKK